MQLGNVGVFPHFVQCGHLRHEVPLLLLGGLPPQDLAGVHPAALRVGHQVHDTIVAVPQLPLEFVLLPRVLLEFWVQVEGI